MGIDCLDGVEQLTRYLDLLNREPRLTGRGPVRGIFAAQADVPRGPRSLPRTAASPAPSSTTTPARRGRPQRRLF